MKIASILSNKGGFVATVAPDSTVTSLLATLAEFKIGAVVVIGRDAEIAGIVSERDVVRALSASGAGALDAPVSSIMTVLVATCAPDSSVEEIAEQMTDQRVRHIPVVDDGQLVGIVSIGDIVKARIENLEDERKNLISYISS